MIIEVEALDSLFFRDGRPFSKGEDVWADGIFPPLPSTVYGAIRSACIAQHPTWTLTEGIEYTKNLRILDISYKIESATGNMIHCYPSPLDIAVDKNSLKRGGKRKEVIGNKLKVRSFENKSVKTSLLNLPFPESSLLKITDEIESSEGFLIDAEDFYDYNSVNLYRIADFYEVEHKVGIARNNKRGTVNEGALYRVGFIRPTFINLIISFEGIEIESEGILKLGGENKLARYYSCQPSDLNLFLQEDVVSSGDEFTLYLSTPALFKKGFYPTKIFKELEVEVELKYCSIGTAVNVGGFDMLSRQPKKMLKAVPAGSIYRYKIVKGNLEDIRKYIKQESISEFRVKEGFGIAFII